MMSVMAVQVQEKKIVQDVGVVNIIYTASVMIVMILVQHVQAHLQKSVLCVIQIIFLKILQLA